MSTGIASKHSSRADRVLRQSSLGLLPTEIALLSPDLDSIVWWRTLHGIRGALMMAYCCTSLCQHRHRPSRGQGIDWTHVDLRAALALATTSLSVIQQALMTDLSS